MLNYTLETINTALLAKQITVLEDYGHTKKLVRKYQCPNCRYLLTPAPRCPDCGQLVSNYKFKRVVRKQVTA
jgi:ssDNA-binding Zn-finger/Zn-ribbon topoisomerase 1